MEIFIFCVFLPIFFGTGISFLISEIKGNTKYYLGGGIPILLFLIGFGFYFSPCSDFGCLNNVDAVPFFETGIVFLIMFVLFALGVGKD